MRKITHIVVHCSATKADLDIGAAAIRRWHKDKGWADIGYHFVIRRNGQLELGRDVEIAGAHVAGHNATTIGICLVGGLDEDGQPDNNYTTAQMDQLRKLVADLKKTHKSAIVQGHRDFPGVAKDCPCFNVRGWALANGL